ncbi:MAG: hypothetical protein M3R35_08300 [Candidatus Eremiobacteraeota bacterium]|nr:hypothetical protein [Candidatus Eremiobacteraeota bacterium]
MHILRIAQSFAFFLVAATAVATAQTPAVESTPVPLSQKPDFSSMQFLSGTWDCSVLSSRRPGPYMTTSTTAMSPDGYWMVTHTTVHKASWIPQDFVAQDSMTYDPSTSRWVDLSTDETGGYDMSTSPGWHGKSIVWTDVAYPKSNNIATNNPTTLTQLSDSKTESVSTFKEPSGRLINVKTTCTKAG